MTKSKKELVDFSDISNAKLGGLGSYIPVINIKPIANSNVIFRATPIPPANIIPPPGFKLTSEEPSDLELFFSRDYNKEDNELDRAFYEYEVDDLDILGVPFTLIPKHKLLFSYEPSSILAKPHIIQANIHRQ